MLRMLKLLPEQAARHWDLIKPILETYKPDTTVDRPETINSILTSLLGGKIELHIFYKQSDNGNSKEDGIRGFVLLSVLNSIEESYKHLLVYFIYSFPNTPMRDVLRAWDLIVAYAKGKGCSIVDGYTSLFTSSFLV